MHSVTPFVGREKELGELEQHLDDTLNYNGSLIIVRGDAGVGKSRLLEEFINSKESQRLWIIKGKSLEDDVRPFSPFVQMIEAHLEKLEYQPQWLAKFIDPEIFPYFAHFLPKLKNYYPFEIAPSDKQLGDKGLFFNATERFFANLVMYKPLVMVIDDIVWMNSDSLELFKYLVLRILDKPILILCSARSWVAGSLFQTIIDKLAERRAVHFFDLENLKESETNHLVKKQFGANISSRFANWLFYITKGNPLFISEILNMLLQRNILFFEYDKEIWKIRDDYEDFPFSPTIESIIKLRLGSLSPIERSLLQTGAVMGEVVTPTMLRHLIPKMNKEKFIKTINRLKAQRLFEGEEDNLRFSHPLIRELLYKELDASSRIRFHRKIGALIKKTAEEKIEEIIYHLTINLSHEEETAELCQYLLKTGKELLQGYNEKLGWHCLTLAEKIAEKFPEQLMHEVLQSQAELSRLRWVLGKNPPSTEETEQLIDKLKSAGLRKEAVMLYRILLYRAIDRLDIDLAYAYLKHGLAIADKTEEDYWVLRVESCTLKARRGELKEAEEEISVLVKEINPKVAPAALWKALHNLGNIALSKGDLETAHDFMCRALAVAEQYNLIPVRATSTANCGYIEMMLGQLDVALIKLNEAVRDAELTQRTQKIAAYEILLGRCILAKGEYEIALKHFDDSYKKAKEIEFKRAMAASHLGRAEAFLEMQKINEAVAELDKIPAKELGKEWLCDFHLLKSRVLFERGELNESQQEIEDSLVLAEKLNLGINAAEAMAQKAMIYLQRKKEAEGLKILKEAQQILKEKGALLFLGNILTRFGLVLGGKKGDGIFTEGLEILFDINAISKIKYLMKKVSGQEFKKARSYVHQRLSELEPQEERLVVNTFGGLSVLRPHELQPITAGEWQSKKARELLSLILCLSENGATREILASYLWPELDTQKSQNNLRVTLTRLNQTLNFDCIIQEGQCLLFDRDRVDVDFLAFEKFFKKWQFLEQQGKMHAAEKNCREAVSLYKRGFLPEIYAAPIEDKQRELREKATSLLCWLATRSAERFEWQEAIAFARRLITIDSSNETAHRVIMRGLWQQGDRGGALRQYDRLKIILKKEFDISPGSETTELHKRIIEAKK